MCIRDSLINCTDRDFKVVSVISIAAIFVIIALVLKSFSLPILLVAMIELAIALNLCIPYFTGTTLPFVGPILISTIQLGATVDYAILMTTRYKQGRMAGKEKKVAVGEAVAASAQSILDVYKRQAQHHASGRHREGHAGADGAKPEKRHGRRAAGTRCV